jgi:hypothetical protein
VPHVAALSCLGLTTRAIRPLGEDERSALLRSGRELLRCAEMVARGPLLPMQTVADVPSQAAVAAEWVKPVALRGDTELLARSRQLSSAELT